MSYLLAFAVVFVKIGLAVMQQRNVEEGRVWAIPPQSIFMQFFDCATYGLGAHAFMTQDWWQVLAMGLGAGSGSLCAMWVDRHWLRRSKLVPGERPKLRAVR